MQRKGGFGLFQYDVRSNLNPLPFSADAQLEQFFNTTSIFPNIANAHETWATCNPGIASGGTGLKWDDAKRAIEACTAGAKRHSYTGNISSNGEIYYGNICGTSSSWEPPSPTPPPPPATCTLSDMGYTGSAILHTYTTNDSCYSISEKYTTSMENIYFADYIGQKEVSGQKCQCYIPSSADYNSICDGFPQQNKSVMCVYQTHSASPTPVTPPAPTPTPSECTNIEYAQCGGKDWAGATCCPMGFSCEYEKEYYSECRPDKL